jgi:hypothetical protein
VRIRSTIPGTKSCIPPHFFTAAEAPACENRQTFDTLSPKLIMKPRRLGDSPPIRSACPWSKLLVIGSSEPLRVRPNYGG